MKNFVRKWHFGTYEYGSEFEYSKRLLRPSFKSGKCVNYRRKFPAFLQWKALVKRR